VGGELSEVGSYPLATGEGACTKVGGKLAEIGTCLFATGEGAVTR
jgi:hypothetical protein